MDRLPRVMKFVGYGPVPADGVGGAQVFFLGIEEAASVGEEEENLRCRGQEFDRVEDLHEAHQKLRRRGCYDPFGEPIAKNPVRTWNAMARIALALADSREWNEVKRWGPYWRQRLGRRCGETFLMECFPVPRPTRNHAVAGYRPEDVWPERCDLLRAFVESSKPKYLIAYGNEPGRYVEQLVEDARLSWTLVQGTKGIEVARALSGLVLARTGFFGQGRFQKSDVPLLQDALFKLGAGPIRPR